MAFSRAEAFAPATVANLGVGFDILGLALEGMGDRAIVEFKDAPGIVITDIEGDGGQLPREPERNVASVSARAFLDHIGEKRGLKIKLVKGLPLSSGLGSSAASAVAAVMALNALVGEPFTREEVLPFSLEGEALVSGYHADNVAPCLLGGIVLVAGITVDAIRPLPVPKNFHVALVTPDYPVPTNEARAILPSNVPLKTMIHQTGKVAQLVDALHRSDLEAIGASMEGDAVVEPARACLVPLLDEVRSAAKRAGAIAVYIGGAGPTLCALCANSPTAKRVAAVMKQVYHQAGMVSIASHTRVDQTGAKALSA
ncbi:MAG: homoserine kinase, partial [Chloroflexi bacterium]|nr:homoserine kinase [Chloroflexota bacterium]